MHNIPKLSGPPRLVFLYGSREMLWPGIHPYLVAGPEIIRETLAHCEQLIQGHLGWSLEKALATPGQHVPQKMVDPALTAVQLALTRAWRERGIQPDMIAARSGGEFCAEYARGVLELEEAVEVVCRWSRVQHERRGQGTLLTVKVGLERTAQLIRSSPAPFFIVADAEDEVTVVACTAGAVEGLRKFLTAQGVGHDATRFTFGPHSPVVDAWKSAFVEPPVKTRAQASPIPYYSAGTQAPDADTSYATRMWQAVRAPALIGRTLRRVIDDGGNIFLEVGGQATLRARIERRAAAAGKKVAVLPTMVARKPAGTVMDSTQARLLELGVVAHPA